MGTDYPPGRVYLQRLDEFALLIHGISQLCTHNIVVHLVYMWDIPSTFQYLEDHPTTGDIYHLHLRLHHLLVIVILSVVNIMNVLYLILI